MHDIPISMNKAYLILAHKNPQQLRRLMNSLNDGFSFFFIHIDEGVDIRPFKESLISFKNVIYVPRVATPWASNGLVKAILSGMISIHDSDQPIEHVILLSGQDYPIKSNSFINKFLKTHRNDIFLEYFNIPDNKKWQPNGGLFRINKYFLGMKAYQRYSARAVNLFATLFPILRRKPYLNMKPYAGSMWWIMNIEAIQVILNFLKQHPGYAQFHKYTFAGDEVFFHTILLNSLSEKSPIRIINDDMRFIKWPSATSSHPRLLTELDMEELKNSEALFARKFDESSDHKVLDQLDEHCRHKQVV